MWFWLKFLFRLKCWSVIQSKDQNINFMLLIFLLDSYRNNKGTRPVTRLSSMIFSRFSKSFLGVAFFFTALRSRCRTECLSSDSRGLEPLSTSWCCPIKESSIAEIWTQATPHNINNTAKKCKPVRGGVLIAGENFIAYWMSVPYSQPKETKQLSRKLLYVYVFDFKGNFNEIKARTFSSLWRSSLHGRAWDNEKIKTTISSRNDDETKVGWNI